MSASRATRIVFLSLALMIAGVVAFVHVQTILEDGNRADVIRSMSVHTFWMFAIVGAVSAWMIVLARESRMLAQEESERQTTLLIEEIDAHTRTDAALQASNAELQKAKDVAENANFAKSRYMIGISHELRSPLNAVLGYGQLLSNDASIPGSSQECHQCDSSQCGTHVRPGRWPAGYFQDRIRAAISAAARNCTFAR